MNSTLRALLASTIIAGLITPAVAQGGDIEDVYIDPYIDPYAEIESEIGSSQARFTIYAAQDSLLPVSADAVNDEIRFLHNLTEYFEPWGMQSKNDFHNVDGLNMRLGEYIDSAPFFRFLKHETPYNNIGLKKLGYVRVVMQGQLDITEDGFYFIYPLEEIISEFEGDAISPTWSGGVQHARETVAGRQQTPWRTEQANSSTQAKRPLRITIGDSVVFDYKGADDARMMQVPQENFIKQSVTPIKLSKGSHPIEMVFETRNAAGWVFGGTATGLSEFGGYNIHARKIASKADAELIDIFADREQTIAQISAPEGSFNEEGGGPGDYDLTSNLQSGWVIDASLGLEDYSDVDHQGFTLSSGETHQLRFSFVPNSVGDYIISHDLVAMIATDGGSNDEPRNIDENCFIYGTYLDEWDETYNIGLQKTLLEVHGVEKTISELKTVSERERKDANNYRHADSFSDVYGGVHTLLPIRVGEDLVDTEVTVNLNYHCDIKSWIVADKPHKPVIYSEESFGYRPEILMKTPNSSRFTPVFK